MSRVRTDSATRQGMLATARIDSGSRVSALGCTIIVAFVVSMATGCAASPTGGDEQASETPRPSSPAPTPSTAAEVDQPESIGFAEGARLDPLAKVGWAFHFLPEGGAWTPNPVDTAGETSFVNADDTCTAYYYAEVFPTSTAEDLAASDEYLAQLSGGTVGELAPYAFDGEFALTHVKTPEPPDGTVENRSVYWEGDGESGIDAARVFTNLDYTTSQMANAYALILACDSGVDPLTVVDSLDEIAKITVDQ